MKKKLFTTILTVAVAVTTLFSNAFTTNAAEQPKTNPLVEQLNALTGNYIGYDMTYADKVKVLNACFVSSAAMQNYTLVVEPSYAYNHTYQSGRKPELYASTLVTKTFLYDHGNFMYDYNDSVTGQHSNEFYTRSSLYCSNSMGTNPTKQEFANWYAAHNLDATYGYKLSDWLNIYSLEQFATVAQYAEIDGIPYLVCNFQPETIAHAGCTLGFGEVYDKANSNLIIKIPLNNYGAYSFTSDLHIFAGPTDSLVPNGHYMYHKGCSYINVNTTTIPAVPANYIKVF